MVPILRKLTTLKGFYRKTKLGSLLHGHSVNYHKIFDRIYDAVETKKQLSDTLSMNQEESYECLH